MHTFNEVKYISVKQEKIATGHGAYNLWLLLCKKVLSNNISLLCDELPRPHGIDLLYFWKLMIYLRPLLAFVPLIFQPLCMCLIKKITASTESEDFDPSECFFLLELFRSSHMITNYYGIINYYYLKDHINRRHTFIDQSKYLSTFGRIESAYVHRRLIIRVLICSYNSGLYRAYVYFNNVFSAFSITFSFSCQTRSHALSLTSGIIVAGVDTIYHFINAFLLTIIFGRVSRR